MLAPSLRAGHEWLFAVVQSGQPVVNGRIKTLAKLALDLAGPAIAERQWELASARRRALLIDRIMHGLRRPGEGYLWRLTPSVSLAELVRKAIDAIRRAGLERKDLHRKVRGRLERARAAADSRRVRQRAQSPQLDRSRRRFPTSN